MILNISKMFFISLLFLLTPYLNHAHAKAESDIFSITGENVLWRKMEFVINDNLTTSNSSTSKSESKLMNYLSFISNEMNELNAIAEQSFKEDSTNISLPSAYVEISSDEIKFHDMIYDDFSNFVKFPVKLETIIPDGTDLNTIKIAYENKIDEIILTGSAEMNGTDHDFILNITEVTFRAEHERTLVQGGGKIVTKSIFEKLTFKTFKMTIVLPEQTICIEFPNKKILRRLADSWMVALVNAINIRFVKPRVGDQSQSYFEKYYKNVLLHDICSSILAIADVSAGFTYNPKMSLKLLADSEYEQYRFSNITFSSFSRFSNCTSKTMTVKVDTNDFSEHFYSHNFVFVFTENLANTNSPRSFLKWTWNKLKFRTWDAYLEPNQWTTTEQNYTAVIKYWSAIITVATDRQGRKVDETKVSVTIQPQKCSETTSNYWTNQFLDLFSKSMADNLKSLIDLTLLENFLN